MQSQNWVRLRPSWELHNMVRALSYFSFLNTPEEAERLKTAKDELRKRGKLRREEQNG